MSTPEPRKGFRWPISIVNTVIYAYALLFGVGLIVFDRLAASWRSSARCCSSRWRSFWTSPCSPSSA